MNCLDNLKMAAGFVTDVAAIIFYGFISSVRGLARCSDLLEAEAAEAGTAAELGQRERGGKDENGDRALL